MERHGEEIGIAGRLGGIEDGERQAPIMVAKFELPHADRGQGGVSQRGRGQQDHEATGCGNQQRGAQGISLPAFLSNIVEIMAFAQSVV
jgi:hypothetical protein